MNRLFDGVGPSPMRCLRALRLLQSYLDGEVADTTAAQISEHLEECRRCGLQADAYRTIKTALAGHHTPDADAVHRMRTFGETLLNAPDGPAT